ncbi:hypothetical protein GCM10022408_27800 [Hymenobacter fastidiosus]|uniref:Uncharacterized protein n=1 Tax=Hymenobacter fastidiosus TaxID=486264 RepID=A0ABP7SL60_9BACT
MGLFGYHQVNLATGGFIATEQRAFTSCLTNSDASRRGGVAVWLKPDSTIVAHPYWLGLQRFSPVAEGIPDKLCGSGQQIREMEEGHELKIKDEGKPILTPNKEMQANSQWLHY